MENEFLRAVCSDHIIKPYLTVQNVREVDAFVSSLTDSADYEYFPFRIDSPNFLKYNNLDPRSVVKGCFLQYNFFPWNPQSDYLYDILSPLVVSFLDISNQFCLANLCQTHEILTGIRPDRFYSDSHFIRLTYQHFPARHGFLAIHRDPVGSHQICAPILSLNGPKDHGLYYINNNQKIDLQPLLGYGDVALFDSSKLHAVEHDLTSDHGTRHILLSIHAYHSHEQFVQSTTN